MVNYIKLFRWQNLLVIAISQCLFQYFIIAPILDVYNLKPTLTPILFGGLVLATCMVAAGGYLINNYFDVSIDTNKNNGMPIIGETISKTKAFDVYLWLNGLALVLSGLIAFKIGNIKLVSLIALPIVLLWFYASALSRNKILGNVLVSFLTGFTLVVVFLFEGRLREILQHPYGNTSYNLTFYALLVYFGFAFITNWIREIIKDLEDQPFDDDAGRISWPIRFGIKPTKWIISALLVVLVAFTIYIINALNINGVKLIYVCVMLVLIGFTTLKVWQAKQVNQYKLPSLLMKIIMVLGVLTMPLFYLINSIQ